MAPVGQARRQALQRSQRELRRLCPRGVVGRGGVGGAGREHEIAAEAGHIGDVVAAVAGQAGARGERLERRFETYGAVPKRRERRACRLGEAVGYREVAGVVRRHRHGVLRVAYDQRRLRERPRHGADDHGARCLQTVGQRERDVVGEARGRLLRQVA
jgi:hypothetical protein